MGLLGLALAANVAAADPAPTAVDIRPFAERLLWFKDAQGGHYAVLRDDHEARVFYGTGKQLYEQTIVGSSSDGDAWSYSMWAPRLKTQMFSELRRKTDGTAVRDCGGEEDAGLTEVTGAEAKKLATDVKLMTPLFNRRPWLFARDDNGVYYVVDKLQNAESYRVWVGKRGALKLTELTDVAVDANGGVFATKSGNLKLVKTSTESTDVTSVKWLRGDKGSDLTPLDMWANRRLIYRDLGIYGALGTLCDNL